MMASEPSKTVRPLKVLVVNSDTATLRLLDKQLTQAGHQVLTAARGREALLRLLAEAPEVVVTAQEMPEMDGLDLCRVIRSHESIGCTYVIVLTTSAEEDNLREVLAAGADDCIVKPYRPPELLVRLRAAEHHIAMQKALAQERLTSHRLKAELVASHERFREISTIDELTGLANRREAMARLHEYWAFTKRHGHPLACMLAAPDDLKRLHGLHGSRAADVILRETARALRSSAREHEQVFRFGDDGFLILCPDSSAAMAAIGAGRMRGMVAQNPIKLEGSSAKVTLSIGVTEYTSFLERPLELLNAASKALDLARQAGGNCVRVWVASSPDSSADIRGGGSRSLPGGACPAIGQGTTFSRVLLVDPDPDVRAFGRGILEPDGYFVEEAGGGHDALCKARRDLPDVIIISADMPAMNGLECTRRLKSDPQTKDIPVVVVAENHDPQSIAACIEAGADEFIGKPLSGEELCLRVRSASRLQTARRDLMDTHSARGEHVRSLVEMFDLANALAAACDLDRVLDAAMQAASNLTGAAHISVMLPDADRKYLDAARTLGSKVEGCNRVGIQTEDDHPACQAFRSRNPVILNGLDEHKADPRLSGGWQPTVWPWLSLPLTAQDHVLGVLNLGGRLGASTFSPAELAYLEILTTRTAAAIDEVCLSRSQEEAHLSIVLGMAKLAECRDNDTGLHVERVSRFSGLLATWLRSHSAAAAPIDDEFIENIQRAVVLHDIGKVAVPDHILLKPGRLTDEEMKIMRTHAQVGADTIRSVIARLPGVPFLEMAEEIAYAHHEWCNGNGYPRGLKGSDIPLAARIAAVADVYDALTTRRPYKQPINPDKAVTIMAELSGSQFDPVVIEALLALQAEFASLVTTMADDAPPQPGNTPAANSCQPAVA